MNAEEVLGSKGRLRIIKVLAELKEPLSLYYLERKTGIRRKSLRSDLEFLEKNGVVKATGYSVKKYTLDYERQETLEILNCLYKVGYISAYLKV
ncbi:MAG: hypothetical protein ACP5LF_03835 [Nitrososphaeria archaeon]|nr:hypothetical protein [Conexivisphaerales archaeon]